VAQLSQQLLVRVFWKGCEPCGSTCVPRCAPCMTASMWCVALMPAGLQRARELASAAGGQAEPASDSSRGPRQPAAPAARSLRGAKQQPQPGAELVTGRSARAAR
jgi:hypothetical protein